MASNNKAEIPSWAPKLVLFSVGSILLTLLAVYVVIKLQDLLLWIVLSLFLSFALEPLVNQLMHRGINRVMATFLVVFGFSGLIVLLMASMVPIIIEQTNEIIKQSPDWLSSMVTIYNNFANTNISESDLLNRVTASEQFLSNYIANLAGNIFGFGRQVFGGILQVLGILLFTFYFVLDGPHLRRIICSFLSPRQQKIVLNTWEMAIEKTGGFMYSRLLLGAISIIFHFMVFSLLGIPFALPLAIWMGIVSQFVPIIGTYIAASLPILMALTQGFGISMVTLLVIIIYQQIENYLLLPKISQKTMELHPAVAFGAVIAGATLGGIIGAFLALPVAAMLQEIFRLYIGQNEVIESKLIFKEMKNTKKGAKRK
jgi:predicted PurR-regulated permease PerM